MRPTHAVHQDTPQHPSQNLNQCGEFFSSIFRAHALRNTVSALPILLSQAQVPSGLVFDPHGGVYG